MRSLPIKHAIFKAVHVRHSSGSIYGQRAIFSIRVECRGHPRWLSVRDYGTTTIVEMDAASKALADAPPNDDRTWAARADSSGIAITTLYNRWRGRPSIQKKAEGQQYLTVEEEKALVAFLLLMSSFGQPVRIKYIPTQAFSIA